MTHIARGARKHHGVGGGVGGWCGNFARAARVDCVMLLLLLLELDCCDNKLNQCAHVYAI